MVDYRKWQIAWHLPQHYGDKLKFGTDGVSGAVSINVDLGEQQVKSLSESRTVTARIWATEWCPLVRYSLVMSCRHLGWRRGVGLVVDGVGCLTIMGSMKAPLVAERHPAADPIPGFMAARPGVQMNALVFQ